MAPDADGGQGPGRPRYQPLGLLTATLVVLLVFAIFFLPFLVLPLAILVVFYIGFAASDRARRAPRDPIGAPTAHGESEPSTLHRPTTARDDEPGAA